MTNIAAVIKKVSTFSFIGIVGAFVDYGTRSVLLWAGLPGFLARACSYIAGSTVAYYLNSFYTFDGDRSAEEKKRAGFVYLVCFIAAVTVDAGLRKAFPEIPNILFWSWFVSQGVATVLNFTLQNFWVFRAQETGSGGYSEA